LVNYALEDSVENFLKTLRQLGLKGATLFDVIIQEKMSISSEIQNCTSY